MTEADARYAVELLDARAGLSDVREGLSREGGGAIVLKLIAYEGDQDGGSHHGNALVPLRLSLQIVAFAEDLIRRELRALKVTPEDESEPKAKEGRARGGAARAEALSSARRREIAKTASDARWGKAGAS